MAVAAVAFFVLLLPNALDHALELHGEINNSGTAKLLHSAQRG